MSFKISINRKIIDKPKEDASTVFQKTKYEWKNVEVTQDEFISIIKAGYAFCPQLKSNFRQSNQFLGTNYIGIDIDSGISIDEALELNIVKNNASFIYTTSSHSQENNRFRIIFESPEVWTDPKVYRTAVTRVMKMIEASDKSCKDAARLFYSNKRATIHRIDKTISQDILEELNKEVSIKTYNKVNIELQSNQLLSALSRLPVYKEDNSELVRISLYIEYHFGRDLGQDFYKCHWINGEKSNMNIGRYLKEWAIPNDAIPASGEILAILRKHNIAYKSSLFDCNIKKDYTYDDYIDPTVIGMDKYKILGIKSPVGTGKTTFLRQFLESCSFDFIAHRVSLVNKLASDFNAISYKKAKAGDYNEKFVSTLHSYHKYDHTKYKKDVTVIDEANQVLRCLSYDVNITSNRIQILNAIKDRLKNSEMIILLDADLTEEDIAIVCEMCGIDQSKALLVINSPKMNRGTCYNYISPTPAKIIDDLKESAAAGKKCYVSCVARGTAETAKGFLDIDDVRDADLDTELKKLGLNTLLVSSSTRTTEPVDKFLMDPNGESVHYDVVIATPTIGSGISIDNNYFDEVFHLGKADVITLSDQLQMPARVRNCKIRRSWFENRTPKQKIADPSVIYQRFLDGALYSGSNNVTMSDRIKLTSDNELIAKMLSTYLADAADGNWHTREKAIKRLASDGWRIENIFIDDTTVVSDALKEISRSLKDSHVERIVDANDICETEYLSIIEKRNVSTEDLPKLLKFHIKDTLRIETIDSKIVNYFHNSGVSSKVSFIESLLKDDETLHALDDEESEVAEVDKTYYLSRKKLARDLLSVAKTDLNTILFKSFEYYSNDVDEIEKFISCNTGQISSILKLSIAEDFKAVQIFNNFLNKFMLKRSAKQKRYGEDRIYHYMFNNTFISELLIRRREIKSPLESILDKKLKASTETKKYLDMLNKIEAQYFELTK